MVLWLTEYIKCLIWSLHKIIWVVSIIIIIISIIIIIIWFFDLIQKRFPQWKGFSSRNLCNSYESNIYAIYQYIGYFALFAFLPIGTRTPCIGVKPVLHWDYAIVTYSG